MHSHSTETPAAESATPPLEPEGPSNWGFIKALPRLLLHPLRYLTDVARTHGPLIRFRVRKARVYFINHPEGLRHVLRTNMENYSRGPEASYAEQHIFQDLLPLIGNSLLTSDETYWRSQRRLINQAFLPRYDENLYRWVRLEVDRLLEAWQPEHAGGQPRQVDIEAEMKGLMLRILSRTMFSPDAPIDEHALIGRLDVVLQYASIKNNVLRRLWKPAERLGLSPPGHAGAQAALHDIDAFIYGLIRACREGRHEPGQLMRLLLKAERKGTIDEQQMRDEIATFLFAGFDTTAEALTWTWALMALHPEYEEKLHGELQETLHGKPPELDDLPRLPWSLMMVLEALRLYPPGWAFYRLSQQDDVVTSRSLPEQSIVMVCPYTLHRHPDHWDRPDDFCPERFRTERGVDAFVGHHYAPFGHGPHICIGRRFALLQAQLVVALIAQRYRIELPAGRLPRMVPGIILRSADGVRARVVPRMNAASDRARTPTSAG